MQQGQAADETDRGQLDLLQGSVGSDDDRATFDEEQLRAEEDAQVESASAAGMKSIEDASAKQLFEQEQALLDQMTDIAENARGKPDARIKKLIEWMKEHMCPDLGSAGAQWNDARVLIFTEYDDTKRYLIQQLEAAISESDDAGRRN